MRVHGPLRLADPAYQDLETLASCSRSFPSRGFVLREDSTQHYRLLGLFLPSRLCVGPRVDGRARACVCGHEKQRGDRQIGDCRRGFRDDSEGLSPAARNASESVAPTFNSATLFFCVAAEEQAAQRKAIIEDEVISAEITISSESLLSTGRYSSIMHISVYSHTQAFVVMNPSGGQKGTS